MNRWTQRLLLALPLLTVLHTIPAQAQRRDPRFLSVGGTAGTMGLGVQVGLRPSRALGVRASYTTYDWDGSREFDGIEYGLSPRIRNTAAMLDLHPGGGAFRLSGGLVQLGTSVTATAQTTGTITIGDDDYTLAQIGALRGRGEYPDGLKPYAGLGIGTGGRVAFTWDLGLVFSGYPTVTLRTDATLPPAQQAVLESDLRKEEANINQEIEDTSWAKYYPVLMVGLVIRF